MRESLFHSSTSVARLPSTMAVPVRLSEPSTVGVSYILKLGHIWLTIRSTHVQLVLTLLLPSSLSGGRPDSAVSALVRWRFGHCMHTGASVLRRSSPGSDDTNGRVKDL